MFNYGNKFIKYSGRRGSGRSYGVSSRGAYSARRQVRAPVRRKTSSKAIRFKKYYLKR